MSTIAAIPSGTVIKTEVTPEELLARPDGKHYELVDGVPMERATSLLAGRVEVMLANVLEVYSAPNDLGWVVGAACGYRCFPWKPKRVRRPDVSFITRERLPSEARWPEGYVTIPPDLAVEVTSPSDVIYELEEKVEEYRRAGIRLIWVIHPEVRVIQVIRGDGSGYRLRAGDELTGEDVLPGFRCPVASLFPPTVVGDPAESGAASPQASAL
jgi:Uma2 family endonuclease